ncbi:MAG: site-specific DNA-methyltransferase, partial [Raineya sp.]|nr:site-specific DNA-methyltransferase [Raineya sp.]
IYSWTNPDDIVLDPMCGSGTTPRVACEMGRKFIGIDISPEYCEISRKRLQKVQTQMKLFTPTL